MLKLSRYDTGMYSEDSPATIHSIDQQILRFYTILRINSTIIMHNIATMM